jgi:hypothetical protein
LHAFATRAGEFGMNMLLLWAFSHPYLFTIMVCFVAVMIALGMSELPNIVAIDNNYYPKKDEKDLK